MQHLSADIAVLGGGPSGCIAAKRLAEAGHRVMLVAGPRTHAACEGLSGRVAEALAALGCRKAVDALGPAVERVAAWNGETSSRNREHVVVRGAFDAALQADAAAAGVRLRRGRARAVRATADGPVFVCRDIDGGSTEVAAGFLLEARGREAPRGGALHIAGPETVALCQPRADDLRRPRSWVAAGRDGWAWFIAPGDGTAVLQVLVDGGRGGIPKRGRLGAAFDGFLSALACVGDGLDGSRPAAPLTARTATARLARPVVGDRFLRIGDAAVAVDPLSGHGVFEAVGGALAAAAAVNTVLRRPAASALAAGFYTARCEDTFARYGWTGRQFYEAERRWPGEPFWSRRRGWPDEGPPGPSAAAAGPEVVRRPVVEDGFVVEREVIVTAAHPRGVWTVADVPVVPLLRHLAGRMGEPWDAALAAAPGIAGKRPAQVETAVRWLTGQGLLRWGAGESDGRSNAH